MIPNTPSEPISSCRRSGPAADSGARPRSSTPAGVTARSPRTMSLNRPYPAEFWPDDRVAAKPPMVANWKLCGKWPSENPCSPSRRSACGPVTPAPSSASPETSSSEYNPPSRRRSKDTTALNWPRTGSRPPTTLVPPPNGTTAMLCREQKWRISATSFSSPGSSTASGASCTPGSLRRSRSSVDLPPARNSRSRSSTMQNCVPTIADSASRSGCDSADGRNFTCCGSSSAPPESSTPRASFSRDRIPSDSGLAASGSPQAFHFIGGRSAACCSSGRVMRYSITYAVNQ